MQGVITAGIVAIGDEILRGDTVDTNTSFLCSSLYACGVEVQRCTIIPDQLETIVQVLRQTTAEFDWVISCGGIGPTPDDLTRQAVAQAFGVPLELHAAAVEEYARRRGSPLNDGQREMCRLPAGSELVWSEFASPPSFIIGNLLVLPGVPQILKSVWATVAGRFSGATRHSAVFRTTLGESRWAHIMARYIEKYPLLKFGSYPKMDREWWVEVRVEGLDRAEVETAAMELAEEIGLLAAGPN
jgi:molybdenum cofactor synthesis domain-containing protein